MRRLLIVLALLFAAGPALADDTALNTLFADYTSYAIGQDPITAGRAGDKKALARMPDVSPGADVLRKSCLEEFKEHLGAIDAGSLSPEGRPRRDHPPGFGSRRAGLDLPAEGVPALLRGKHRERAAWDEDRPHAAGIDG